MSASALKEPAWSAQIVKDSTGCCHSLSCIFDVWQCSLCSRVLDWVNTSQGMRLAVLESMEPPESCSEECVLCGARLVDFDGAACERCSEVER